jgi:hypothetical protein
MKPPDRATKQSRVFRFFGKPHVNDGAHFLRAASESFRVISDQ